MSFLRLEIVTIRPHMELNELTQTFADFVNTLQSCAPCYMSRDDYEDLTHEQWVSGEYDSYDTELECVEAWAGEENLIDSEEEATRRFEKSLLESMDPFKLIYMIQHTTDIDSYYSDWCDSQCKDNQLHAEQYKAYEYVGDEEDLIKRASARANHG